jgi:hypothetical protein
MKRNLNLITMAFISLTFIVACNNSGGNSNTSGNSNKTVTNSNVAVVANRANVTTETIGPPTDTKLNVANFIKLETGMKYADVVKILGSEGELIDKSESEVNRTKMYKWSGENGAFLKVFFLNDKLYDKAHTGLK